MTFEVAIEQPPAYLSFAAKCRVCWWVRPPDAWSALGDWVKRAEQVFESAWTIRGDAASLPAQIEIIDDAAARHKAQRLFHEGHCGRVAELLSEVAQQEPLTAAELKMLELALKRAKRTENDSN